MSVISISPDAKEIERLELLAADQRAAILNARHALEEGRRGDALAILKSAASLVLAVPGASEDGRAA